MPKEIDEILTEEQIEALERMNALRPTALRNIRIRRKYREMRRKKIRHDVAKEWLSEEFSLEFSTIEDILYRKGPRP